MGRRDCSRARGGAHGRALCGMFAPSNAETNTNAPEMMKTRAALLLAAALWGASAQAQGICGRSAEVQTYILGWTYPKLDCADVTAAHLAAITAIAPKKAFPRLRAGDLAGLTNVRWLELN